MDRLTKKIDNPYYSNDYEMLCTHEYHVLNKLGKLEDLFELYNINSIEELELALGMYIGSNKNLMMVRKIESRESKVIKYDGTNLNAVKQFIEKDCKTVIYREGEHNGNPYLDVSGRYTLFLNKDTYIVQAFDLYGNPSGFYEYHSLEELKNNFIIAEEDKSE